MKRKGRAERRRRRSKGISIRRITSIVSFRFRMRGRSVTKVKSALM